MATRSDHPVHFVEPAKCRAFGEMRPDRNRVDRVEEPVCIVQGRVDWACRELNDGDVLACPIDGGGDWIAAMPLDLWVRSREHADDAARGAAEVKYPHP